MSCHATAAAFSWVVDGHDERLGECLLIIGCNEPASVSIGDDVTRPTSSHGNGWQPAGHPFDEDLPELLLHRGQDDDIGGRQDVRKLVVITPTGQKHVA